jgi:hypothetical protein
VNPAIAPVAMLIEDVVDGQIVRTFVSALVASMVCTNAMQNAASGIAYLSGKVVPNQSQTAKTKNT